MTDKSGFYDIAAKNVILKPYGNKSLHNKLELTHIINDTVAKKPLCKVPLTDDSYLNTYMYIKNITYIHFHTANNQSKNFRVPYKFIKSLVRIIFFRKSYTKQFRYIQLLIPKNSDYNPPFFQMFVWKWNIYRSGWYMKKVYI